MTGPANQLRTRLLGLLGTLVLLLALAGIPSLLLAIDATPDLREFSWTNLMRPDDGTLALTVAKGAVWILWAIFSASVVMDIAARVRHIRAPQLPGLAVPQLAAGRLVGLAALLFVAIPSLAAVSATPRAYAAGTAPPPIDHPATAVAPAPVVPRSPAPVAEAPTQQTDSYTVQRGDSLWKIAQERLGAGSRFTEIRALNHHVLGEDPDFIVPGTVLRVPHVEWIEETYVVEPGDTLSEVAVEELHDVSEWPSIASASRATVQPDGEHLTDPDLIKPGWHLTIPRDRLAHQTAPKHLPRVPPATPAPVVPLPPAAPPEGPDAAPGNSGSGEATGSDHGDAPVWLIPGLAGSGAALAGAAMLVLRQHRRTQQRFRRPGHMIAPTPPELLPFEKTVRASGSLVAPRIGALDIAMRQLARAAAPAPYVVFLSPSSITVHLTACAELMEPWTGSGVGWSADADAFTDEHAGGVAPYPLLVSLGTAEDGSLVYLNLESDPSIVVAGDAERAVALGRHIAAELALNPWSSLVEIEAFGIAAELADIDPSRLHHHAVPDDAFASHLVTRLNTESEDGDPDRYRAVITTADGITAGMRAQLAEVIERARLRLGTVLIGVSTDPAPRATALQISATGRLSFGGLELTAAGLSAEAARGCSLLVDLTRETESVPIPVDPTTERVADMAGALVPELTESRADIGATGDASLLPEEDTAYEAAAAITSAAVHALAPKAIDAAAAIVGASDPHLDEDLAYWHSDTVTRPKLHLLGPVYARTSGALGAQPYRRPFRTEMLALLFLHPAGLTLEEIRQALNNGDRVRKDLSLLRQWLGGPDEENLYLPPAQAHGPGPRIYKVRDVVCDLDLFRRLRSRGQSRGSDGVADLRSALDLVAGEPFSDLRDRGWSWLLDGDRYDHIITASIVDTAHIVTTHALAVGDLELATLSAEKGYLAAKYDETACLDMIAVEKALGNDEAAERLMQNEILDRADDDLGPVEPAESTTRIIRQRGWERTQRTG